VKDALGSVQSVLLLGGGSEIGLAIARALVAERALTVVLAGRAPDRFEPSADELRGAGAETVETVEFDADEPETHAAFVDGVFDRHGDVDVAVVAFGVLGEGEEAGYDPEAAAALLRTNVVGAVSAMAALARRMKQQGHGTIVVLSSVAGERVRGENFVYGSSKAGLDGFSLGLGDALVGTGVDVVVVRPGFVRTRMTAGRQPAPFATTAEQVAAEAVRGLERGDAVVWAPAVLRWVMLVVRHLPRVLFRRLSR
jgi:decaprenylphospho-beta-D-erythro-pentofuranosid-2-ulose 2-reductase